VAANVRELALLPVIGITVVVGALLNPAFLTTGNILNILQQSSELGLVVIALSACLFTGHFDLSLESTVGLAPMVGGYLIVSAENGGSGAGVSVVIAIAVVFAVGLIVGLLNGFMIAKLKLNPFIVTLAMLILLRGVATGITNGTTLFEFPAAFTYLGTAEWLGVPVDIYVTGVCYVLAALFFRYHRLGRSLYAIGGNPTAARAAGIRVDRIVWGTYAVAGVLAALAGLLLAGRIQAVPTDLGQNMIFSAFAAAVIGGVSLNGGTGRIMGALTGVLLLGTISNMLVLAQVPTFWVDAAYGLIILIALGIAKLTSATPVGT
jgi:ribose/xylose/arabinose/galactoside ABC-type transport system permease subunit